MLHGYPCIVAGIDKYLHISMTPRDDKKIIIRSKEMGTFETTIAELQDIDVPQNFLFVLKSIQSIHPEYGFDMEIESDFSSTIGFGSSAAVTVATLGSLLGETISKDELFSLSYDIVYTAQGKKGSGADIAASVYGGVLYYENGKMKEKINHIDMPITAVYAGYKTPTPKVIEMVRALEAENPEKYKKIYKDIGACVQKAWPAFKENNQVVLKDLFNQNHLLLKDLGVSDDTIEDIVSRLLLDVSNAKISGAGLGDCVIALGKTEKITEYETVHISISQKGISFR